MAEGLRVLVADDEKPARSKVVRFLTKCDPDAVIEEVENGKEAAKRISENSPNLVFLDIQMPGMTGFEVVESVGAERMPSVIFATAFDQYALNAFEAQAIDYLLKPFSFDRFQKAYERAKSLHPRHRTSENSLNGLINQLRQQSAVCQRLAIRTTGKIRLIHPSDIVFIKSEEHYVKIQLRNEELYERRSLKDLEALLDPDKFRRIHRTTLVNLDWVLELQPLTHGDYSVILRGGSRHTLSRRYRESFGIEF